MMLLNQDQHCLGSTPYGHETEQDRQVLGGSPSALPVASDLHDFLQTMTMAVVDRRL
jgi:hypothetical protein